jgi:hypothetical protein
VDEAECLAAREDAMVNHRYAERMLELQREWLDEAEAVLSGGSSRSSRPRSGSGSDRPE